MQVQQWRHGDDWIQGTFLTTIVGGVPVLTSTLDALVAPSQFNHPCVVPKVSISSTSVGTGAHVLANTSLPSGLSSPTTNGGSSWYGNAPFAITKGALDYLQFSVTGLAQVIIRLCGIIPAGVATAGTGLVAGEIRNGCIANVYVDGSLVSQQSLYNQMVSVIIGLDNGSHTIKVEHSGSHDNSFSIISGVAPLTGTTVAANLMPTETYHGTPYKATWMVQATGSATYDLYRTLPGGSQTKLNVSALNTGTTYTTVNSVALGHTLLVGTGSTLTNADQATYTTDQITLGVVDVTTGVGSGTGNGIWQSQVIDSGTPDTQWLATLCDANYSLGTISLSTGNTPTPDGSWTTTSISTPPLTTLPSGRQVCVAGFMAGPRGRFGQVSFHFPAVSVGALPIVRDLSLFFWVPERDPDVMSKLALGGVSVEWGNEMMAFMGGLASLLALRAVDVQTFVNSLSISGSDDQYLLGYQKDFRLPTQTGEPEKATRRRMLAGLQSNGHRSLFPGETDAIGPGGGSMRELVEQVAAYVTGIDPSPPATPLPGTSTARYPGGGAAGWQCSGVWIYPGSTTQEYHYVIPAPSVNGFFGGLLGITTETAKTMIRNFILYLNPVCSIVYPSLSTWNVHFS
jgi:hypothetical protein